MDFPEGRFAIKILPSLSTKATAETKTVFMIDNPHLYLRSHW